MLMPITFDRFARVLLVCGGLVAAWLLFGYLAPVLVPFIVAGVIAYLLNPVVDFLQHKCRLRIRVICVLLALVGFLGVIVGLLWLCVPPMVSECLHLKDIVAQYLANGTVAESTIPLPVREFFMEHFRESQFNHFLESGDLVDFLRKAAPKFWAVITSAAGTVISFVASMISLLYLFFLLLDYHRYSAQWQDFIPPRYRQFASQLFSDVTYYFCGYFRGQLGIALSNCVMFTLGFIIVGFPMPVALGCFIGIISFVPYLQVAGIVPALFLALLRSAETGENFWMLTLSLLAVYLVVQIIQDTVVTPRIMGHIMGLSPAIILFSLSVGGYVLGIGGLIIALPVTTIALAYYKRYVVKDKNAANAPASK